MPETVPDEQVLALEQATREMTRLLQGLDDDQLGAPTPCPDYLLGDLLDHVGGLSQAFAAAARKDLGPTSQAPSADASRLGPDWRSRIPEHLATLSAAWRDADAWQGMTRAGGVDLPGEVAYTVAVNEVVVHGWDVARASGQVPEHGPEALAASMDFVTAMSQPGEEAGREGLFGPVVPVPDEAPLMHRIVGLAGRDPSWTPREA